MIREEIMPGVTLAQVMPSDALELFRLVDRERARLTPRFPWTDHTRTIADTRAFTVDSLQKFGRGDGPDCVIRVDDEIVGVIGCLPREGSHRTFEVGYWLAEDATGRGIITTAARWLIDRLFTVLDGHRIVIRAATDNQESQAVPRRLGFREEAVLHGSGMLTPAEDLAIFTMRRADWPSTA